MDKRLIKVYNSICMHHRTDEELREIEQGCYNGLSVEQIKSYLDFSSVLQMHEVRWGLQQGLSTAQMNLYAKQELRNTQMYQIRLGLKNGLSIEQVKLYAKKELRDIQMEEIRLGFENGLTSEQVELYAKKIVDVDEYFDNQQMREIRLGFENGLSMKQIKTYAFYITLAEKMRASRIALQEGMSTHDLLGKIVGL